MAPGVAAISTQLARQAPNGTILQNPLPGTLGNLAQTFFTGPATRQYQIGPLTAGKYPFHCEVHPTAMTGTLTVQ